MGFPRGHTRGISAKAKGEELENLRCSAVGNSFHVGVFACVFSAVLFQRGVLDHQATPKHSQEAFWHLLRDSDPEAPVDEGPPQ